MATERLLEGRRHRYLLEGGVSRRVFRARDDEGRVVAIRLGPREALLAQAALTRLLPPGTLPDLVEFSELAGGRVAFLVTEFVRGYSLSDVGLEGRRLSPAEGAGATYDLASDLEKWVECGVIPGSLPPDAVMYDTRHRHWRILSPGRWLRGHDESPVAAMLATVVLESTAEIGADTRLARALAAAARGDGRLRPLARAAFTAVCRRSIARRLGSILWHHELEG